MSDIYNNIISCMNDINIKNLLDLNKNLMKVFCSYIEEYNIKLNNQEMEIFKNLFVKTNLPLMILNEEETLTQRTSFEVQIKIMAELLKYARGLSFEDTLLTINQDEEAESENCTTVAGIQGGGGNNVKLLSCNNMYIKKFKLFVNTHRFKFINIPKAITKLENYLTDAFNEIITIVTKDTLPHYKIGLTISLPNYSSTKPLGLNFISIKDFKAESNSYLLGKVSQSNTDFLTTDNLEITSQILNIPSGRGKILRTRLMNDSDILNRKKSLIDLKIPNATSFYCLPISLIIGKCLSDKKISQIKLYKNNVNLLLKDVKNLLIEAKINVIDTNIGLLVTQIYKYIGQ